jgi:hypothetical protein
MDEPAYDHCPMCQSLCQVTIAADGTRHYATITTPADIRRLLKRGEAAGVVLPGMAARFEAFIRLIEGRGEGGDGPSQADA